MERSSDHEELKREFMSKSGADIGTAEEYLFIHDWDLNNALTSYYDYVDSGKLAESSSAAGMSSAAGSSDYTGPRTLDGRPAPQAIPTTSSASSSKQPQKKKGLATLSSLGSDHPRDDHHRDDHPTHRDTYAGGEKSGLAVQDPNQRADPRRLINDLLSKAKSEHQRPPAASPAGPSSSSSFRGVGQTLGGEGTESRIIPDPSPRAPRPPLQDAQVQERTLHLWRDGFSIDHGELHRFDDPNNTEDLRMIQAGRAPIHLMNVRYNDPIDVKLEQHDENFRQLPRVYRPFGGEGRRLGSPVPGEPAPSLSTTISTTDQSSAATATGSAVPSTSVDESQPTIMIRIHMLDGTRLPARFNRTQTVDDIYEFIRRASPDLRADNWVLATTFPNKNHTDKSQVIGDMDEFSSGGTAVVKRI